MSFKGNISFLVCALVLFSLGLVRVSPAHAQESIPHLHIYKSAFEKNVNIGDQIHFGIAPQVHRLATAHNVVVTDVIPAEAVFVSATGGGVYDAPSRTVSWTIPFLVEGQEPQFELILTVVSEPTDKKLFNTARVTSDDGLELNGTEEATAFVNIKDGATIFVTKTTDVSLVEPLEQVTFNIDYVNEGNITATNAVLSDALPAHTGFIDATLGGVYDVGTNTVTWPADSLEAGNGGGLLLIVQIDPLTPNDTTITNTARMSGDNFDDASGSATITVDLAPVLVLTKTADIAFIGPGENITYLLEFSNQGNDAATDVTLEDAIPVNTTYVSSTGGGVFDGSKVTWDLSDTVPIEPGNGGSVSMTVQVDASVQVNRIGIRGDVITNIAVLSSTNASSVAVENRVPVIAVPLLEISKTANSDYVDAGANVTYTLHYENNGTATAENIVIEDFIPENTSFVSATGGGALFGDKVVWTDPGLNPGAVGQVQLVLNLSETLADGDEIINTATVLSDNTAPVAGAAVVTVKNAPDLEIVKTANVDFVQSGQQIVYTLVYKNNGNEDAVNVTIEDLLPQGTTFVFASGGGVFSNGTVTWAFPHLGSGQTGSVNMVVTVGVTEDGDVIRNNVTLDCDNAPAVSTSNEVTVRVSPILELSKDANLEFVEAGGQVTFTLQYENVGNAAANNVVLQDNLPILTTFISASGGGVFDQLKRAVTWTDPGLSEGATGQVQLTLKVDGITPDDTTIINSATIASDETSPVTASDSIIIKRSPDLQLTKTADVHNVSPGEQITYVLEFRNVGNATATKVILEDLIPGNTSFVSASGGGVFSGDRVHWELADLLLGDTGSVSLTVRANDDVSDGDIIDNVATLDSDNAFAVSASDQVIVNLLPQLVLSKTAPGEFVEAGSQVTFNLYYQNIGNAAATNIVLADRVPLGTTFVSATGGGVLIGDEVTWTEPSLDTGAIGQVQITLKVGNFIPENFVIFNSATLSSNELQPVSSAASVTVKRTPVLDLVKTSSVEVVNAGDEITFTLTFINTGNATAVNLLLEDAVPRHTSFVSATGGGTLIDNIVRWTSSQLSIGIPGAVAMTVRVDPVAVDGSVIHNTATIDSTNSYAVTAEAYVVVYRRPVLTLVKTANAEFVEAGEQASYTLEMENVGNDEANNLVLEESVPVGTTFVSASPGGLHDPLTGLVSWAIPSLAVGEMTQVTFAVELDELLEDGTVIQNSATLSSEGTQPVTASDSIIVKRSPELVLEKDSNVEYIGPGEYLTYVLAFNNTGNANAVDVVLEDTIPADTTYVSSTGGGVFNAGEVTWSFAVLPLNSPGSVSLTVLVNSAVLVDDIKTVQDGTIIRNTATLDSSNAYAVSAEDSVVVKFSPALQVTKTANATVAIPGEQITYTLAIENIGNVTATNAVLEDTLPDKVSFVSASDGGVESAGIVTWTAASIPVGGSGSVTVTVRVDSPLDDGTTIYNSSSLHSDQTPPVSADHTLNVQSSPVLSLTKTADQSVVNPGDLLTYSLLVENAGNANDSGTLVDSIPDHTTFVSASDFGSHANGIVTWDLPSILVGATQTVTLTVQVNTPLENGTLIYNSTTLSSDKSAPISTDHSLNVQSAPVLILEKTVDQAVVNPGDELVYILNYGNTGNANAPNAALVDNIAANTSFVSASSGYNELNGEVSWDLGVLNAGASGSVTLTVLVDSPLAPDTLIYNHASLEATEASPVVASVSSTVQSAARLVLSKSANTRMVLAGEQVIYELSVLNNGNANATGVTLKDWLPANTSFVSASDGGTESNRVVSWPNTTVNAGESASVSLTVLTDSPLNNATLLFNISSTNSNESLPAVGGALVVVQSEPLLTLEKTANVSLAQPGDLVTYTLSFGNIGNANAINYVLDDIVPADTTFISATGGGIESAGVVTWKGLELLAGSANSVTMTVQIDDPLANDTIIGNLASLVADRATAVDSSVVVTIQSAPVLSLLKTASASVVEPGDLLTYTFAVENNGNANATNVVLKDVVPVNTSFVSANGGEIGPGGVVTWTMPELLVGVPALVTMTVQVYDPLNNGTLIINAASLRSDETSEINDQVTVTVSSSPVLNLSKTADKTVVNPGNQIIYTLSLANSGNANASSVVLEDTIPAHTSFVSATGGGNKAGGVVTWTTPELLAGSGGSVTMTVVVDSPLDNGIAIINTATLDSVETGPVDAELSLNVQSAPVLTLVKTADKSVVNPGDQITYTLSLANSGNANASNVLLEDTIPAHTSFVSATGGGTNAGGVVTWTTTELPAGVDGSVTLTVLVDTPLDYGTRIDNSATLGSDQTASVSADNSVSVQSAPVLTLVKTADKTLASPGDLITYRIEFGNTGNANAQDAILVDQLPADTTFVSATAGGTESSGVVTWPAFQLPVAVNGSVFVIASVNTPLENATLLHNVAALDASGQEVTVTAFADVVVQSAPVPVISKSADVALVQQGELITYTINYANDGSSSLQDAVLVDELPTGTLFISATEGGAFNGTVVSWLIGQLNAAGGGTVRMTVQVDDTVIDGDIISNVGALSSSNAQPVTDISSVTVLGSASLEITKTTGVDIVQAGEEVVYTIAYSNTGNAGATGLILQDAVPAQTTFVAASDGGVLSNGVVTWHPADLPPGASASVTLTVLVGAAVPADTSITNSVSLSSDSTPPLSASNILVVYDPEGNTPDLRVQITADVPIIEPHQMVGYSIDVKNVATVDAVDVLVVAFFEQNVEFVSASDGGRLESNGFVSWIRWDIALLTDREARQISYTVKHIGNGLVASRIPFETTVDTIRALVSVSAGNALPGSSDFDDATVLVVENPALPSDLVSVPAANPIGLALMTLFMLILGLGTYRRKWPGFI